jgi:hypothetical protein
MLKLDLKHELKPFYNPSAKKVEVVEVPEFQFIQIDGVIEPGLGPGTSPAFQVAMQAMYGAAYTLKFMVKQRKLGPLDYPVMALEGLWWVENGEFEFGRKIIGHIRILRKQCNFSIKGGGVFKNVLRTFLNTPYPYFMRK